MSGLLKAGDLVTCELRAGIFQIIDFIRYEKCNDEDNTVIGVYYYRKVFDKNYELKLGKTEIGDDINLRPLSKKRIEKLGSKINLKELSDLTFDPKFDPKYEYYFINVFISKNEYQKEIIDFLTPHLKTITKEKYNVLEQILKERKLIRPVKIYNTLITKPKPNEILYRLEFGRYINDFHDPKNMTEKFYRTARLVKINYTHRK